jgi:hypothetical protein
MSKREKVVTSRVQRMAERAWDAENKRVDGSMMSWSGLMSGTDHDSDLAVYCLGFIDGYNAARVVQPKARKKAKAAQRAAGGGA